MKIKVGEYVRTKNGHIGKVIDISHITGQSRKKYLIKWNISKAYYITNITIIKNGKNITDLIEVGDFVNGFPLMEPVYNGNVWFGVDEGYEHFKKAFGDIKTILTHEQYEQNCYRLEEK